MMRFWTCVALTSCAVVVASCSVSQPPRKQTIAAPTLSCEEANRLAYRTVKSLDYEIASLQVARPGQPGHIVAKATRGRQKEGKVTIVCSEGGAVVEPESTGLAIPSLVGAMEKPGEFPQMFRQAFNVLRSSKDIADQRGPEKGLNLTMTPLNNFESQMEFAADLPASGVLPIRVVISNNTPRPYGLETDKVVLMSASGERVAPIAPPASGQGKALQGSLVLQPGQTLTGFLFYPAGNYTSARTTLVDKETDEGEGFSVQF